MHICWISESPVAFSGYGTQTLLFAKEFQKHGHRVTIVGLHHNHTNPYVVEGIPVIPMLGAGNALEFRALFKKISPKPDAVVVFTDIHFVEWLFANNERDIRTVCPLVLFHLWDNGPFPDFNLPVYNSIDKLICASQFSYELVNKHIAHACYTPLGVDSKVFLPLPIEQKDHFRKMVLKEQTEQIRFIIGSTNANLHRKRLADLMLMYDKFAEGKTDTALLLHCNIEDGRGVNLESVRKQFLDKHPNRHLIISTPKGQSSQYLNNLYNMCDCTINIAHSEGFGLQTVESMMAGVPVIVGNYGNHPYMVGKAGILVNPVVSHVTGGVGAPYIYEHYVSETDIVSALNVMYFNTEYRNQLITNCRKQGMLFEIGSTAKALLSHIVTAKNQWKSPAAYNVATL